MVRKTKAKSKKIELTPIAGLSKSECSEFMILDDSVQDGEWVETSKFPYMKFNFEKMNPMQAGILEYIDKDVNLVICSKTGSGKTLVIEMLAAYTIAQGKNAIYMSPMKSLSNEKIADWNNIEHDFADKKVAILTGDYGKSDAALKQMNEANINIITNEMLDSVTRSATPEKHPWIYNCGILLVDESHNLGSVGRGDKSESALMRFSEHNPNARIALVSATIPNVDELKKWLTLLNGKETIVYESKFRPCSMMKHYIKMEVNKGCSEIEAKQELISKLLNENENDSFITFVGSKKIGKKISDGLTENNIPSKFYKADLPMEERNELCAAFNKKEFRSLVSTSGLSVGVNLCARRVLVPYTTYGLNQKMTVSEITQMMGRCGRYKYETEGDAYVVIKDKNFNSIVEEIQKGQPVISQMQDADIIAFHVLSSIMNKKIRNPEDLIEWYKRTLAKVQTRDMELYEAKEVFNRLLKCGCIILDVDGENYVITQTGAIASNFYLLPEDMLAWKKNFDIFYKVKEENNLTLHQQDLLFAQALSHIPTWEVKQKAWISQEEISMAYEFFNVPLKKGSDKIALGYYLILNSDAYQSAIAQESKVKFFHNTIEQIKMDSERIISALSLLDVRTKKWQQGDFWSMMATRLKYGVPPERLELCKVEGIGGARSKMLWDNGIRSINDLIKNQHKVKEIVGDKVAEKIIPSAMTIGQEAWW